MRTLSTKQRWTVLSCGLLMVVTSLTGCQSLRERTDALKDSSRDLISWHRKESKKAANVPAKMVAIWSESTMYGPGQKPTRGLGGRIYVYNRNHQPIKVDGELVVYAYQDEEGEGGEHVKPDRKYAFSPEELEQFYSPSEFGPSYSVWLPWDEVGGNTQSISVVPVIKTEEGQALVGDHSRNILPGRNNSAIARRDRNGRDQSDGVRRVSYENRQTPTYPSEAVRSRNQQREVQFAGGRASEGDTTRSAAQANERLKSHTIELPATMQQRLRQIQEDGSREAAQSSATRRALKAEVARLRQEAREQAAAERSQNPGPSIAPANEGWAYRPRSSTRREPFRPRAPIARAVQEDRAPTGWTRDRGVSPSDLPSQPEDFQELPQNSHLGESGVPRVWIEP